MTANQIKESRHFWVRWSVAAAVFVSLAAHAAPPEPPQPPIRLGQLSSTSPVNKVGQAVLLYAYAAVEQPVQFVELPLRRSLQMVLDGSLDGEVFRVASLSEREPSLHRVPTSLLTVESRVYVRRDATAKLPIPVEWQNFSGYRVAYERGSLQIENNLKSIAHLVQSNDVVEAIRLVKAGAADVAILNEPLGANPHPLAAQSNLVRLEAPLEAVQFYHYLGNRHGELAKKLDGALRKMQSSGQLESVRLKALMELPTANEPR